MRAAEAVRMLARIDTYMPVKPARPEQTAPTRKAMTVLRATSWVRSEKLYPRNTTTARTGGDDADGLVLAGEESFRAFTDGVGDGLHFGGAGVSRENDFGEGEGSDEGEHADTDGDPKPNDVRVLKGAGYVLVAEEKSG